MELPERKFRQTPIAAANEDLWLELLKSNNLLQSLNTRQILRAGDMLHSLL